MNHKLVLWGIILKRENWGLEIGKVKRMAKKKKILHCSLGKDKRRWREISPVLGRTCLRWEELSSSAEPKGEVNSHRRKQSNPKVFQREKSAAYLLGRAQSRLSKAFPVSWSRITLTALHRLRWHQKRELPATKWETLGTLGWRTWSTKDAC